MKREAEMVEGTEAYDRFKAAIKTVLRVPKGALPAKPSRTKKKAAKPRG